MKNSLFNSKASLSILLLILQFTVAEAKDNIEKTKTISKEIVITEDTKIKISNNHGNITIRTGEDKTAKIEAYIKVIAEDNESIEKLTNRVDINIKEGSKNLNIETKMNLLSNVMKETDVRTYQKLKFRDGTIIKVRKYEINYVLTIPSTNPLEIESSFHDVVFENDIHGKTNVKLTSGDLIGKTFTNTLNLRLNFSDAKLDQVENMSLKMTSSKLELNQAKNLDIENRFSDLVVKRANKITMNSTNSDLNVDDVKFISGESRYGTIVINHLIDKFYLKGMNTSIKINQIKNEFQEIYLHNSSFCKLKLHFENQPQYQLKYHVQFGSLYYPKEDFSTIHANENEFSGSIEQVNATTKYAPKDVISAVKVDGINNALKIYHN